MVGLGSIGWSAVPIFLTFLGYAFEFELGHPDPLSWLPWAIAFDSLLVFEGILGIAAGRLVLRRSRAAVTASFSAAGFALVSLIPGYFFWLGANADTSFFLLIVVAPAIFFGAIYSAIGGFAYIGVPVIRLRSKRIGS
ncbi:MAG: hypothetical protein ACE1Y2_04635 [Stenotrophomonas maltophilia]